MVPRLMTLSRCLAESAKAVPCGLLKPLLLPTTLSLPIFDMPEVLVIEEVPDTLRSIRGHADRAAEGDAEGDVDSDQESDAVRVKGVSAAMMFLGTAIETGRR